MVLAIAGKPSSVCEKPYNEGPMQADPRFVNYMNIVAGADVDALRGVLQLSKFE